MILVQLAQRLKLSLTRHLRLLHFRFLTFNQRQGSILLGSLLDVAIRNSLNDHAKHREGKEHAHVQSPLHFIPRCHPHLPWRVDELLREEMREGIDPVADELRETVGESDIAIIPEGDQVATNDGRRENDDDST